MRTYLLLAFLVYTNPLSPNNTQEFDVWDMLNLINLERKKHNIKPLKMDQRLVITSQRHSDYMNEIGSTDDNNLNEYRFWDRINKQGYNFTYAVENVAHFIGDTREFVDYMQSYGGATFSMLDDKMVHFGAGMNNYYWTQEFAKPKIN